MRDPINKNVRGEVPDAADVPLIVDLDGTLIVTDSLLESAVKCVAHQPWSIFILLRALFRGRAFLKGEIAARTTFVVNGLPYRQDLLAFLRAERRAGRKIVLATAAHESVAHAVGSELGVFDEVLATKGNVNLKGTLKRDELIKRYGVQGFDYVGDSRADIPVWEACRTAHLAGKMRKLPRAVLSAGAVPGKVFPSRRSTFRSVLRAARIQQWVKNVLIFVPALAAHRLNWDSMGTLSVTFFSFSFLASGTYILNDLIDLPSDRDHPRKKFRPFASGEFSIKQGLLMSAALIVAAFLLGGQIGRDLLLCLLAYAILTVSYSSFLKNKPIIDVVALAFFYTLRVFMGGIVSGFSISPWLFQFSIFLFLSLAFVKRYSELIRLDRENKQDAPGRNYRLVDMNVISQAGLCSGYLASLVIALYMNGQDVHRLYPRHYMLWGVVPLFVYWITRVWLVAHRGNMNEDPIIFAFKDKVSYIVGVLVLMLLVLGMIPND